MIRVLSRLLRRRRVVLVDQAALQRLAELAVIGEADEVVQAALAEELRWLNLESGES